MVCESPAPEAIAPCTCLSVDRWIDMPMVRESSRVTNTYHITIYRDTDEDWRYVACAFEFEQGIGFNLLIVVIDTCNQVLFVLFRFFKLNKEIM